MKHNAFLDGAQPPDDASLQAALGQAHPLFLRVLGAANACEHDWKHYGKKYGWKLKVHADDKTLHEVTVFEGGFLVSTAIRGKELETLRALPDAAPLMDLLGPDSAAAKGYGLKIEVQDAESCQRVTALAALVLAQRTLDD